MRPIDADALTKRLQGVLAMVEAEPNQTYANAIRHTMIDVKFSPTINAEPVRHENNTTFITTTNLGSYTNRIIVDQGRLCKVYYADEDARHGAWVNSRTAAFCSYETEVEEKCSLCGRYVYRYGTQPQDNYCPNCGAKMDLEVQDD